ncbi:MAG: hypothetical protein AABX72_04020 [Nanoarchaeota archaeon]
MLGKHFPFFHFPHPDPDLTKYILLEASDTHPDLLVSIPPFYSNIRFDEQEERIMKEHGLLMTVDQLREFFDLLNRKTVYNGKGKKVSSRVIDELFDHFFTCRSPYRGERLGGRFVVASEHFSYEYYAFNLQRQHELFYLTLPDYRMHEPVKKVDLEYWLEHSDSFGIPLCSSPPGILRFFPPVDDGIPYYAIDRDYGPILSCQGTPDFKDENFGVRKVILK